MFTFFPSSTSLLLLLVLCKSILGLRLLCLAGISLFDSVPTKCVSVCSPQMNRGAKPDFKLLCRISVQTQLCCSPKGNLWSHIDTLMHAHRNTHKQLYAFYELRTLNNGDEKLGVLSSSCVCVALPLKRSMKADRRKDIERQRIEGRCT